MTASKDEENIISQIFKEALEDDTALNPLRYVGYAIVVQALKDVCYLEVEINVKEDAREFLLSTRLDIFVNVWALKLNPEWLRRSLGNNISNGQRSRRAGCGSCTAADSEKHAGFQRAAQVARESSGGESTAPRKDRASKG